MWRDTPACQERDTTIQHRLTLTCKLSAHWEALRAKYDRTGATKLQSLVTRADPRKGATPVIVAPHLTSSTSLRAPGTVSRSTYQSLPL
ncbi:hypothetical protein KI387_044350, partial [Taxus chinensis]